MEIIIGKGTKVDLQKTLAADVTLTTISQATEGVCTASAAHTLANGDWVVVTVTSGMVELDGQIARVKASATPLFTLEGIDTTLYSSAVGGTAKVNKITAWEGFDNVKKVDFPEADPDRLPASTVHGLRKTTVFGQDGEITGTMMIHSNPNQAAVALVRAATKNQTRMALRVSLRGTKVFAANCEWSGGRGISVDTGAISESKISMNAIGDLVFYAS